MMQGIDGGGWLNLARTIRAGVARAASVAPAAVAAVAMVCVTTWAHAQTPPAASPGTLPEQPAPATPPAATQPQPAPPGPSDQSPEVSLPPPSDAANPTPEHVADAKRLILATGISRSFSVMIAEFMDQIGNSVTQEHPDLIPDMHVVLDQLKPEFDRQAEEMIDLSAQIYARLLSQKDIDAILAFYNSEAGKRYVALQPQFLNQLLSGTQAWQQKIAINMMKRIREEMKKKGHVL